MIQDYEEPSLSASDSDWASTARVHCECAAASLSCLPPLPASEMSGYNLQRASLAGHLLAGFLEQMLQGYMEAFHEFQMQRGFGKVSVEQWSMSKQLDVQLQPRQKNSFPAGMLLPLTVRQLMNGGVRKKPAPASEEDRARSFEIAEPAPWPQQ